MALAVDGEGTTTMGADATPAGWYPDVERPGGERYWDGSAWTEHRRGGEGATTMPPPFAGTPGGFDTPGGVGVGVPPFAGSPQGYQAYAGFQNYQKSSNAGVALGLSIAGIVCCGIPGIAGLIMGRREMNDIDAGLVDPSKRGLAQAAFVVGCVSIGVMVLGVGFLTLAVLVGS